jgi:hypothetical protein
LIRFINQDKFEQHGLRLFITGNDLNKINVELVFTSNVNVDGNVVNNWHEPFRYIFMAMAMEEKLLDRTSQTH